MAARLKGVYKMATNRGYPSVPALNALVQQSGVEMKDIKGWFAKERKAQGHAGNWLTTPKEKSPVVKDRARLPVSTKGAHPSAS